MKILLVLVTVIAVFTVDCRDFSNEIQGRDTAIEDKLFPEDIEDQVEAKNSMNGPGGNILTETQDSVNDGHQMNVRDLLVAAGSEDPDFHAVDQQIKKINLVKSDSKESNLEGEKEQRHRKLRRSRCKARNACVVMAGFCVTNATLCGGRLVPEGCKGTNCQCCVPGTIDAKFDNLKEELMSLKEYMNNSNSYLNSELQSLKDSARCPEGLFRLSGSNQCFKYFTDLYRSWNAAKSKCAAEGLVLAKPYNPVELRSYLVMRYGDNIAWLGARGTGSYVKWDRDGKTLSSSNPMWYSSEPSSSYLSSSYCLFLTGHLSQMKTYPNQPYRMWGCSHSMYALCELI